MSVSASWSIRRVTVASVSAAAHVFKAASAEIRAEPVRESYIEGRSHSGALQAQYGLWRIAPSRVSFIRRLLMELRI